VPPAHFGGCFVVARRRSNAVYFIGGDAHTQAGPADEYPVIHVASADAPGNVRGNVGVIYGLALKGANVDRLVPQTLDQFHDFRPDFKTSMVGADCYPHENSVVEWWWWIVGIDDRCDLWEYM